ncbi:MAG TPA: ATP-binding protein [Gaiellaceae bacterium]|nr:ATP-binding protein [Gaiellaceae bacterium]
MHTVAARLTDETRLELLARLLDLATGELDPDELLAQAAAALADAIGDVTVTYVDVLPGPSLRPRHTTDPQLAGEPVPLIPATLDALQVGPMVIEDVRDEPWLRESWPDLERRRVRAAVDVPLHRDGELHAIVWFNSSEPRRWTPEEIHVLTQVTQQLSLILERAEDGERRRRADEALRRRDAILAAISVSAEELLVASDWRSAAGALVERLGEAIGASRAYLFENSTAPDGDLLTSQLVEWVAPGIAPELHNPALQNMSFRANGLDRWLDVVGGNRPFGVDVRDLTPREQEFFGVQGIRSLMTVPIFVDGAWWGFVGFDDCTSEREWSAAETDALRLAASVVAAAITHERADRVLREQEQKLRAVFEAALDAIFITDEDGTYIDVNAAAAELLGVPREGIVGKNVRDFLPEEELPTFEPYWLRFTESDGGLECWRSRRADGTILEVEASTRPRFLPGLNIAFLRDVTQRRRLERELVNAQKLDSLGRLAGGVAHDFNNLLTAIGGYTELLLDRVRGDAAFEHDLRQIELAAARAAQLTRQLLAFARKQVLQPVVVDLNEVLDDLQPLLTRVVGEDVALELRRAAQPLAVLADPGQLEQVLVNLALNARDAMPTGGVLTITTCVDGDAVALEVADTGEGMDDETQLRAFEPFFTTRPQSVGLGLASVYGIVSQSNGSVTVTSEPGRGSTFRVELPRVVADAADGAGGGPSGAAEAATILLVEDEDVVRALAERVLERRGYRVISCADGSAAVEAAAAHDGAIDLLLTDVVMPGLRGPDVAARVRAQRPDVKVLYMSGYAEEALLGLADEELIEKPFAIDELAARVETMLRAGG